MNEKIVKEDDLERSVSAKDETIDEHNEEPKNIIDRIGVMLKAEIRGVERVPEDKRVDLSLWGPLTMFFSPNMSIAALSTGALGTAAFGLDFWTATLVIIFWTFMGALPVGFYSMFGMKFGLRQQILSRYFTGNIMGRVFAFFNVISCIGWNAVNIIPSVELLASMGPLPPWAGCLIFVILTCAIALLGYKVIHLYERYSAIPNFIVYLVLIARLTKSGNFEFGKMGTGKAEAGTVLTYMGVVFGFIAGWSPSAADYFVYMPADTPKRRVFWPMVVGLVVPSIFTLTLGAACGAAASKEAAWAAAFEKDSIGGLVYQILVVNNLHGFGKFCCVILALSSIANNLPGSYSLALSIQAIWSPLAKFPRLAWCLIGNFVSLALSIPAYYVFSAAMSNFLSIIGYNVSVYIGISLSEHFFFRKGFSGYDVSDFANRKTIPIGISGVIAFAFGVASTVLTMNQTWYSGVISQTFGKNGGELSFEMNIAISFLVYLLVRPFEIRYFKETYPNKID